MSQKATTDSKHIKIAFELDQDENGYPPDTVETMWAVALEQADHYCLDNIPIFAKGVSSEDVVRAKDDGNRPVFRNLEHSSGNSVIRVFVTDASEARSARDTFRDLGCASEQSYIPKLFALEIPRTVSALPIMALLEEGLRSYRWEYEIGVLRHSSSSNVTEQVA